MASHTIKPVKSSQLFVKNLPPNTSNYELENIFSTIGPIKRCFVVTEKGKRTCLGYGYVSYAVGEDADKAISSLQGFKWKGKNLEIQYSNRRIDKGKSEKTDEKKTKAPKKINFNSKKVAGRVVTISGLNKEKHSFDWLKEQLEKFGKTQSIEYPMLYTKECQASVIFVNISDAINAIKGINLKFKNDNISAALLNDTYLKQFRVIVRNLPFTCTAEELEKEFSKFGSIYELKLPPSKKSNSSCAGYAFINYTNMADATKAIEEGNKISIKNRPIAVDFTVSKNKFVEMQKEQVKDKSYDNTKTVSEAKKKEFKNDKDKNEYKNDKDEYEDNDKDDDEDKHKDKDEENEGLEDIEKLENVEDLKDERDDEEDDNEGDDDDNEGDDDEVDDEGDDDDEDDDEEDYDEDIEDEMEEEDHKQKKPKDVKKNPIKKQSDLGLTLFIRNISYQSTEEDLQEKFEEYGPVKFCVLTRNPDTGEPKGTGFVRFETEEATELCLQMAYQSKQFNIESDTDFKQKFKSRKPLAHKDESDIILDGRRLIISKAISREEASTLKEEKSKKPKDNRNLYLAELGVIKPGTKEATELSASDLQKRSAAWHDKKLKLANPNYHVSKVRLSVRNLPKEVTEKELKHIFVSRIRGNNNFPVPVVQAKIVRDNDNLDKSGQPQSRGFGFIQFKHHQHALTGLERTNNIPGIFPKYPKRLLIVEFALENIAKVQNRLRRIEVEKKRALLNSGDYEAHGSKENKKRKIEDISNENDTSYSANKKRRTSYDRKEPSDKKVDKKLLGKRKRKANQKKWKTKDSNHFAERKKRKRSDSFSHKEKKSDKNFEKLLRSYSGEGTKKGRTTKKKKWDE